MRVYASALSAAEVRCSNDRPAASISGSASAMEERRASGPTYYLDVGHVYTTGANAGQSLAC